MRKHVNKLTVVDWKNMIWNRALATAVGVGMILIGAKRLPVDTGQMK